VCSSDLGAFIAIESGWGREESKKVQKGRERRGKKETKIGESIRAEKRRKGRLKRKGGKRGREDDRKG